MLFSTPRTRPMIGVTHVEIGCTHWVRSLSNKFDRIGARLADEHYSRQTPGSPMFMPPGQTICLIERGGQAVWGWHRPHPASGIRLMSGLDGWVCCIFRNAGSGILSSDLVLDAEAALATLFPGDCGQDGMLTYIWDERVRSKNPGYCYKMAGWTPRPEKRTVDGKKTLLTKPFELAGIRPEA